MALIINNQAPPWGRLQNNQAVNGNIINRSGVGVDPEFDILPDWVQEVDGYREKFARDQSELTRVFQVPWGYHGQFAQFMLADTLIDTDANGNGVLRRKPPFKDPEFPWLYAVETNLVKGLGFTFNNPGVVAIDDEGDPILDGNGNPIQMAKIGYFDGTAAQASKTLRDGLARVAVTFRALDYEVYSDDFMDANQLGEQHRWTVREVNYAVQALPLRNFELVFDDQQGGPVPESGQMILPSAELIYRWLDLPEPPNDISFKMGSVNADVFDASFTIKGVSIGGELLTGGKGLDKETLLMLAPELRRHRNATGRVVFDCSYHFGYRPQGWNKFPDASGAFRPVARRNGAPLYSRAAFDDLFRVPAPRHWHGIGG